MKPVFKFLNLGVIAAALQFFVSVAGQAQEIHVYTATNASGVLVLYFQYYEDPPGNWILHGDYQYYYDDGTPLQFGHYNHGKLHGQWTTWYVNGALSREEMYDNGSLNGLSTAYWPSNGIKQFEFTYDLDVKHGPYTRWDAAGKKTEQGIYENDIRTEWDVWGQITDPLGRLMRSLYSEAHYTHGQLNGDFKSWWDFGPCSNHLYSIQHWTLGILDTATSWEYELGSCAVDTIREYSNGKLKHEAHYYYGLNGNGIYWEKLWADDGASQTTSYYTNGVVASVESFNADGHYEGVNLRYDINGRLTARDEIRNGPNLSYWAHHETWEYGSVSGGCPPEITLHSDYFEDSQGRCGAGYFKYCVQPGQVVVVEQVNRPCQSPNPPGDGGIVPSTTNRTVSGYVLNAQSGQVLTNVTVNGTMNGQDGSYNVEFGDTDSYTLEFSRPGFKNLTLNGSFGDSDCVEVTAALMPDMVTSNLVPTVLSVKTLYGTAFFGGLRADNLIVATVDWAGLSPHAVRFSVNGSTIEVPTTDASAQWSVNMGGLPFMASTVPQDNVVSVTAVSETGEESTPFLLDVSVLPEPLWMSLLGSFYAPELKNAAWVYNSKLKYPVPPISCQITEAKLGSTLWKAWSLVPYVGGKTFGLKETQGYLEVEAKSDGSGSVFVGGETGIEAAGGEIRGKLGGKGKVQYLGKPQTNFLWRGASLIFEIEGSMKKEIGVVAVFPTLSNAMSWPVVGRPITWFNNMAKVEGKLYGGFDMDVQIVNSNMTLGFDTAEGKLKMGTTMSLICEIPKIKASATGSGEQSITVQFPTNPAYLKNLEAKVAANLKLEVWSYELAPISAEVTFNYDPSAPPGALCEPTFLQSQPLIGFRPVSRDFLKRPSYSQFAGGRYSSPAKSRKSCGPPEPSVIIYNAYPHAEPAMDAKGNRGAVAYVYFDPAQPTLRATEIYLAYDGGGGFNPPIPVHVNTHGEFSPTVAFDRSNRVVAAWERVKDTNFAETNDIVQMAPRMEIVYACYDPGSASWTVPAALTDNDYLDYGPKLSHNAEGDILLTWIANTNNLLIGDSASPDRVYYARWQPGSATFAATAPVPQAFANCSDYAAAYSGTEAVLAYVQHSDDTLTNVAATEIGYTLFNGSAWGPSTLLTSNSVQDSQPVPLYRSDGTRELFWLNNTNLVRLTNWSSRAFTPIGAVGWGHFKAAADPSNRVAILTESVQTNSSDLCARFYDPASDSWSEDRWLTCDGTFERDFAPVFTTDGALNVAYCRDDLTNTNTDLCILRYQPTVDLAIQPGNLSMIPSPARQGTNVTLTCVVENLDDWPLTNMMVAFYNGNPVSNGVPIEVQPLSPAVLPGGGTGTTTLSWLVPQTAALLPVYAIVDPSNLVAEVSETNNVQSLDILLPDLRIRSIRSERLTSESHCLVAVVENVGSLTARGASVLFQVDDQNVRWQGGPDLDPGTSAELKCLVHLGSLSTNDYAMVRAVADPYNSITEVDEQNNDDTLVVSVTDDTDKDGMPDEKEYLYWGDLSHTGDEDFDHDGINNQDEIQLGMNPTSADDALDLRFSGHTPGSPYSVFSWRMLPDLDYFLYSTTNLASSWRAVSRWTGTNGILTYTNLNTWDPIKFYRVGIQPPAP